jgi:hypothetical protein
MAEREINFLRLVERGIFGYGRSPYLPLLKMAGCELEDIRNMVKDRGLEDTLRALREARVYVTFEEFKGRDPIVLEALEHSSAAANMARIFWSQAGTFQVKRMEPIWTSRGKLMPLHVVRQPERSSS